MDEIWPSRPRPRFGRIQPNRLRKNSIKFSPLDQEENLAELALAQIWQNSVESAPREIWPFWLSWSRLKFDNIQPTHTDRNSTDSALGQIWSYSTKSTTIELRSYLAMLVLIKIKSSWPQPKFGRVGLDLNLAVFGRVVPDEIWPYSAESVLIDEFDQVNSDQNLAE